MDKQYIIDEIRRTAVGNDGVALGKARFAQETGIRESDWYGKYATRWGDLVTEAGFRPNGWNPAFDEDQVIGRLALLVRELGHVPVKGELQLKRRADPSFPSHNVFSRFGSKAQLVTRVREYCVTHDGYDDVLALLPTIAAAAEERPSAGEAASAFGVVYLLKSGRHFKIGQTNSAGRREYELRLQLPERASIIHEIRTDDPVGIEKYWHNRFAERRLNGEWFDLRAEDVRIFRRRKFM